MIGSYAVYLHGRRRDAPADADIVCSRESAADLIGAVKEHAPLRCYGVMDDGLRIDIDLRAGLVDLVRPWTKQMQWRGHQIRVAYPALVYVIKRETADLASFKAEQVQRDLAAYGAMGLHIWPDLAIIARNFRKS